MTTVDLDDAERGLLAAALIRAASIGGPDAERFLALAKKIVGEETVERVSYRLRLDQAFWAVRAAAGKSSGLS